MPTRPTLESSLADFVGSSGLQRGVLITLGNSTAGAVGSPSKESRQRLLVDLAATRAGSRSVLWIWLAMVMTMFVLSTAFAFHHRERVEFITVTMLGGSGALVYLFVQLKAVHAKLVSTDVLLALLPKLPPEQWAKVSIVLLDGVLRADKPVSGRAARASDG